MFYFTKIGSCHVLERAYWLIYHPPTHGGSSTSVSDSLVVRIISLFGLDSGVHSNIFNEQIFPLVSIVTMMIAAVCLIGSVYRAFLCQNVFFRFRMVDKYIATIF